MITRGGLQPRRARLIHAASGGVGLAAVNIATWRGAEIFATAGTPRNASTCSGLGISHVFDSRSLDFADASPQRNRRPGCGCGVELTRGRVHSCEPSTLARHGRFLELGKRDILRNTSLGLAPFAKHLSFTAIDVGTDLPDFQRVWREVVRRVQDGSVSTVAVPEFPGRARRRGLRPHGAEQAHRQAGDLSLLVSTPPTVDRVAAAGGRFEDIIGSAAALLADTGVAGVARRIGSPDSAAGAALTEPCPPALATSYRAPSDETERKIVEIWEELLGISGIGVDDDFLDLRGDSLLAAQVTSRLYRTFP